MTLAELGRRMSVAEFRLWRAEYAREPWGEMRADLRAGTVAATVANYAGKMRDKAAPAARATEFMPFLERPPEPAAEQSQSPAEWVKGLKDRAKVSR